MAVRKVITAKHRTAAELIVRGESAYQSLLTAGFSRWSARRFGELLRKSWALREAIREAQRNQAHYLTVPAPRRRRDRIPVARAVRSFCLPEDDATITNTWLHKLHADEHTAKAIAKGEYVFRPTRCSTCGGPLEGADRWCPHCERLAT